MKLFDLMHRSLQQAQVANYWPASMITSFQKALRLAQRITRIIVYGFNRQQKEAMDVITFKVYYNINACIMTMEMGNNQNCNSTISLAFCESNQRIR